jgi:hypothetical protein
MAALMLYSAFKNWSATSVDTLKQARERAEGGDKKYSPAIDTIYSLLAESTVSIVSSPGLSIFSCSLYIGSIARLYFM